MKDYHTMIFNLLSKTYSLSILQYLVILLSLTYMVLLHFLFLYKIYTAYPVDLYFTRALPRFPPTVPTVPTVDS